MIEYHYYSDIPGSEKNYEIVWINRNYKHYLKYLGIFLNLLPAVPAVVGVRNHVSSGLSDHLNQVRLRV